MEINEGLNTEDLDVNQFINPPRTGTHCLDKDNFSSEYKVREFFQEGFRISVVEKKNCSKHHIIHLHGGAYLFEATEVNRILAEKLAAWGFRVSVVDYPLAPEHSVDYCCDWMLSLFQTLLTEYPNDIFHFFGDSAGGGLALSVLSLLRDREIERRPTRNVLSSPLVDVSMENIILPDQSDEERQALLSAGQIFSGGLGVKSPLVSPIYGDLSHLGSIMMSYDEDEILAIDCAKFAALGNASEGTKVLTYTVKGLYHDFAMAPGVPEAEAALEMFHEFLLGS